MGAACCGYSSSGNENNADYQLTPEQIKERRDRQAQAAEERAKDFKQGGGGEKLKAKTKELEEAEKKNKELGGPNALKWTV